MGVPLLPHELDGAELVVELAWGADAFGGAPAAPTWTDVTEYVRQSEPVQITRGRSDEADTSQPAECQITFDNTDGSFSLAGDSPNWPHVRRGVPVRVRVPGLVDGLYLHGRDAPGSYMLGGGIESPAPWTPTADDLDIRFEIDPSTWRPTNFWPIAGQWIGGSGDDMWIIRVLVNGQPEFGWSPDGTAQFKHAAPPIAEDAGRVALRVTLDVDDGAGGHVITWYTADSIDGPWTVYDSETRTGTTSVHPSSQFVAIGATSDTTLEFTNEAYYRGMVHDLEVRDGIDGPVAVDPGLSDTDPWPGPYLGPDGNQWAPYEAAEIVGGVLFVGNANGFTPGWSLSGKDRVVRCNASGSLRRVERRRQPLESAMRHGMPEAYYRMAAYFPLEDGDRAEAFTSGLPNSRTVLNRRGETNAADFEGFPGSAPVVSVDAGSIDGAIPEYEVANNATHVAFLLHVPEDGMHDTEDSLVLRVSTRPSGVYSRWDVHVTPGGDLRVKVYDWFGNEYPGDEWLSTGWDLNGRSGVFAWEMLRGVLEGQISLYFHELHDTVRTDAMTYVMSAAQPVEFVQLGDRRHSNGAAFGHVMVAPDSVYLDSMVTLMEGHAGETATDRMVRLANENGVYLKTIGASSVPMGPQPIDTFMNAIRECERADMGVLFDGADPGLRYVARSMRESVEATVTLDAAAGDVAPEFEPVHDDQGIVNRFTATQVDGSAVTVERTDGPVGTTAVDVYAEDRDLNVNAIGPLRDYAAWRVHLGTNPDYRYPSVSCNLRASPRHAAAWLRAMPSARVDVLNPRAAFPHIPDGTIHLLTEGTETNIGPYAWTVTAQASDYDPWRVAVAADLDGTGAGDYATPADTVASHLAADAAESATALDVATEAGPYWGDGDAPYDVLAGGRVVTVNAVTEDVYADTFARTVASGWGTADTGQGYAYFAPGGSTDFSVADPDGIVSLTTADASVVARVVGAPLAYVDHSATVVVPTDAVGIWHGLASGYVDDQNYVFAVLRYDSATGVILQLSSFVDGTGATYGDRVVFGSYSAGMEMRVRLRKAGSSFLARAWRPSSQPEPVSWHVGGTVPELAGAGEYGTYSAALSGGPTLPVDVAYRDVRMHNPQRLTVDPIPAALPAGGDVAVNNPPIAGL